MLSIYEFLTNLAGGDGGAVGLTVVAFLLTSVATIPLLSFIVICYVGCRVASHVVVGWLPLDTAGKRSLSRELVLTTMVPHAALAVCFLILVAVEKSRTLPF